MWILQFLYAKKKNCTGAAVQIHCGFLSKWKFTGHGRPSVFKGFFKKHNPNRASCANLDTQVLKDEIWQSCHQCIQILFYVLHPMHWQNCRDGLDVFRKPDKVPHFSLYDFWKNDSGTLFHPLYLYYILPLKKLLSNLLNNFYHYSLVKRRKGRVYLK